MTMAETNDQPQNAGGLSEVQQNQGAVSVEADATSEFGRLLQKAFKPKTDKAKEAVETAVRTLAEQVLQDTHLVSDDALTTIEELIAKFDEKLSSPANGILHPDELQKAQPP